MGWGIKRTKITVPEIRVPRMPAKPARLPRAPRRAGAGGRLRDFDLTIFSANRKPKGVTQVDVIKALIAAGGNRTNAAENLGVTHHNISQRAKKIRQLSDEELQKYAGQLHTTVAKIKAICADMAPQKGITHIEVIRELLASGGNRRKAAEILRILPAGISRFAKNIRQLPDTQFREYAKQLSTTVAKIKAVCVDLNPQKGINHIDVIRELLASDGSRTQSAEKLGISQPAAGHHAKNIRQLPDAELKKYAKQLGTTAAKIRAVCADMTTKKGITHIDVIRELLASEGSRTQAAEKLGISQPAAGQHAKNIRQLPDTQLREYAKQLSTTVAKIRAVCIDLNPQKCINHIDVIRELLASGGSRTQAAEKLGISQPAAGHHAKNIRQLPNAQLLKYAAQLGTTIARIKEVCAEKQGNYINVIRELLASGGNRTKAAKELGITQSVVIYHIKNIMQLSDTKLREYADQLGATVERVKAACAPLKEAKGKLFVK